MQARQCIGPPRLGERQRGQKDPPSPLPYTDHCILGHCHLTVMTHLHLPATRPPIIYSLVTLCCADSSLQHQGCQDSHHEQQEEDTL